MSFFAHVWRTTGGDRRHQTWAIMKDNPSRVNSFQLLFHMEVRPSAAIDHERGDPVEELAQERGHVRRQCGVAERRVHELEPAVARACVDRKRHVPHPQTWVPALLDVALGPTEAADQEVAQPCFGALEIVGGVHRAEDVVARHLRVEGANEPREPVLADTRVDLIVGKRQRNHRLIIAGTREAMLSALRLSAFGRRIRYHERMSDEAPKSAYELAMARLRQKDAEAGVEERHVTDAQKTEIAEVRRVYAARVAEREIMHKASTAGIWDPAERQPLEDQFRHDVQKLNDERDTKIERLRQP